MQISLFVVLKKCSTNLVFKITNIYSTISINLQGQGKFPLLLTKRHWNRPPVPQLWRLSKFADYRTENSEF